jgi:hypothetical protein
MNKIWVNKNFKIIAMINNVTLTQLDLFLIQQVSTFANITTKLYEFQSGVIPMKLFS